MRLRINEGGGGEKVIDRMTAIPVYHPLCLSFTFLDDIVDRAWNRDPMDDLTSGVQMSVASLRGKAHSRSNVSYSTRSQLGHIDGSLLII